MPAAFKTECRPLSGRNSGRFPVGTVAGLNRNTQQKLRDGFTRDFLDRNDHDPLLYDMLFNNDRAEPDKIADTIAAYVMEHLK